MPASTSLLPYPRGDREPWRCSKSSSCTRALQATEARLYVAGSGSGDPPGRSVYAEVTEKPFSVRVSLSDQQHALVKKAAVAFTKTADASVELAHRLHKVVASGMAAYTLEATCPDRAGPLCTVSCGFGAPCRWPKG